MIAWPSPTRTSRERAAIVSERGVMAEASALVSLTDVHKTYRKGGTEIAHCLQAGRERRDRRALATAGQRLARIGDGSRDAIESFAERRRR